MSITKVLRGVVFGLLALIGVLLATITWILLTPVEAGSKPAVEVSSSDTAVAQWPVYGGALGWWW